MHPSDLRPRSASEIVDVAFRLLRRHYGALLPIAVVAAIPRLLIQLAQLAMVRDVEMGTLSAGMPTWFLVGGLLLIPVYGFTEGWFVVVTSDVYRGGEVRLGDAARRAVRRMLPVVGAVFLVWVPVMLGFVLLAVPGLWLLGRLYTTTPAVVLEEVGPITGLRRTWGRTRGRALHTLGSAVLSFLIYFVLYMGVALVGGIVGALTSLLLAIALTAIVSVLVYPILPVVATVLYYDLRIRAEGYDVEVMAEQLGADPLGGAPGASPRAGLVGS